MKLNKKGSVFDSLGSMAIGVATLAIALTVTFLILAQGKAQVGEVEGIDVSNTTDCATSIACNATNTLTEAVDDIPGWVPLIIIGVVGSILLGMVALYKTRG